MKISGVVKMISINLLRRLRINHAKQTSMNENDVLHTYLGSLFIYFC